MILERVDSPNDIKGLAAEELTALAGEIRAALLQKMSKCGGHFGSNFGMVEMTIALHYVFDSPRDRIVFDVSHQCYTHKILTGRKNAFLNEDEYRSVTGYTCPEESDHDLFNVGHTATSISLGCGLAKERDLAGRKENVIVVIGDGALSGGEAYEGLNYAWELHSNLIIVVNDNQMAISDDYGGLYQNLKLLRETGGKAPCNLFRALGLDYRYLDNGHDIEALIREFSEIKDIDHPVVVHIRTQKGYGYFPAESNKEMWHWRPPFDVATGDMLQAPVEPTYDTILRDFLLAKIKSDPKVVAMVAAVPLSIRFTKEEREAAGKQFVDVCIAEEHAITMAGAIAKAGGKPVFTTDCTFFQRAYDQIAQELCINSCPATMLVRNASVYGINDVTHLGLFDIAMFSNMPNLVYLVPTNQEEYLAMVDWSLEQTEHPVAIRCPKGRPISADCEVDTDYSVLNRYKVTKDGDTVAILGIGNFYRLGCEVAERLAQRANIKATVINPRYVSGIDRELLEDLKCNHSIAVTLEDSFLDGGFGEKIARFYGASDMKTLTYGIKKNFIDRYQTDAVLRENRLEADLIAEDILKLLGRT